jgi:uncharacterized protein (TIGR02145 family)
MSVFRTTVLPILILFLIPTLNSQDKSIEIHVHDNYTEQPIDSALVTILLNGDLISSVYTDISGRASISIPVTNVKTAGELPSSFILTHNYPNPFSENTNVNIEIPEAMIINAAVYNILGQRVAFEQILVSGGRHKLNMSLSHLPMGIYFLRIEGNESQTVKLLKLGGMIPPSGPVFSISQIGFNENVSLGKVTKDEFTLRISKYRYNLFETSISIPGDGEITIPLERNNYIEFVVVNVKNHSISRELDIIADNYETTITTPDTLILKSGMYHITDHASIDSTIEIPSIDMTIILALDTYSISGKVTEDNSGLEGITITATGGHTQTVVTNSNGQYLITGIPHRATVTITPSLEGFEFNPPYKTLENITQDTTGINFAKKVTETVSDIDGNVYQIAKIGDQWWMAENLRTTRYADGMLISGVYAYEDEDSNAQNYGGLYTFNAVVNGNESNNSNPSGVQGVCPTGWHVPSDAEWQQLEMYLGMTEEEAGDIGWRKHEIAGKLKSTRTEPISHPRWNEPNIEATNESGFTALPGGYKDKENDFHLIWRYGYWWTSTESFTKFRAWYRGLDYGFPGVLRYRTDKQVGLSVRCVMD